MILVNLIVAVSVSLAAQAASTPVDLLKKLVEISSGTSQAGAVNKVQGILKGELDRLGFSTEMKKPPAGIDSGSLLIANLKGESPQLITLVVHADTVFEPAMGFNEFKISSDGKIATGPGVIDDKGSMVVLIEGLKKYLSTNKPKYSLRVLSSPSEETGSKGFDDVFAQASRDSFLVLGLEPAMDNRNIVSSRRGNAFYLVSVTGREAHAGRDHKAGVNACLELAKKLEKLSRLTNYARNVTLSVGHIEGGQDKANVVCGFASAKIDTRFEKLKDGESLKKNIDRILSQPEVRAVTDKQPAKTEYQVTSDSPPLMKEKTVEPYLKTYLGAINKVEAGSVKDQLSGGSADTNSMARPGLMILDGLGAVGGKMHTKEEFLDLSSLDTRSTALAEFLKQI